MDSVEDVHVEVDIGNLLISSIVELKPLNESNQGEEWLKSLAQKGTQILINKMWDLPCEYRENVVVAKLPEPTTKIPREKHVPKPKPPTRWEKFAQSKGLQKRKKDKLVFDEATKDTPSLSHDPSRARCSSQKLDEWKPKWGYRSNNSDKPWLIEIPEKKDVDPYADFYSHKKEEKTQRVAKNEYQRLRNIAESSKKKVRNLEAVDRASKEEIARSVATAKTSTASLGKFMNKLPKERPPKNLGEKRKFESNFASDMKTEKDKNLRILEEINKKRPKLDIQEAVQLQIMKKPGKSNSSEGDGNSKKKKKQGGKSQGKKNKKGSKKFDSFRKNGRSGGFKKTK